METAKEVVSASDTTVKEATNTAVTETAAKVEEVKESTKEIAVAVVEETKEVAATAVAQGETAVAAAATTTEAVVANATEAVTPVAEGLDGEVLYKSCASCHGQKAEKEALGKSQVIAGWDKEKTIQALNGYKAGTYGGVMKNIMKGQVATKTDAEIDALATFISKL
ncbi:MAG: c-type cytochrome [Aliarcobacter sp.]|nr:c-type cytochrome [Aliarcobacter sp.]